MKYHPHYPDQPLIAQPLYKSFQLNKKEGPYLKTFLDQTHLTLKRVTKAHATTYAMRFEYEIPEAMLKTVKEQNDAQAIARSIKLKLVQVLAQEFGIDSQGLSPKIQVFHTISGYPKSGQLYWQWMLVLQGKLYQTLQDKNEHALFELLCKSIQVVTKEADEVVASNLIINSSHWVPVSTLRYLRSPQTQDLFNQAAQLARAKIKPKSLQYPILGCQ